MSGFGTIAPPRRGERITAEWCRAVTDAALRGGADGAGPGGAVGRRSEAFVSDLPFRVSRVMCATETGGAVEPHWTICLPDGSVTDGMGGTFAWDGKGSAKEPLGPSGGRIAPEGRCYVIPGEDGIAEGSEVWCAVQASGGSFGIEVRNPDTETGTDTDTETGTRLLVARMEGGRIRQFVLGTVIAGTNADVGLFPWDASTKSIGAGAVMVGRGMVEVAGIGPDLGDGRYYVKVTLGASASAEVTLGTAAADESTDDAGNVSYVPLYVISGGRVAVDYRGIATVPAYD